MKNILAPTDFSDTANNAVEYAAALAAKSNTDITLFHCFHVPVIAGDAPVITITFDELEKDSKDTLKAKKSELEKKYPGVKINTVSKVGFTTEEIVEYSQNNPTDLIVMGISGSGKLDQLLGSTATAVSKKSEVPVLIVPPEAGPGKLGNIVFAFDFKEIENTNNINIVVELARCFNSRITALNIKQEYEEMSPEEALAEKQANTLLSEVSHKMVKFSDTDTIHGIHNYLKDHDADLLVMMKRKHGFFDLLFNGSNTRKMAFHTHIPLLIIHE
ncbi:MAG: universal stress protein [Bacteroidetes bacterium]|nr:universal stress protein [Bacteroidota bacterium]